eukprot:scpid29982/ scgid30394/ ARMADILLO BTB ARABIDOPSIS PROTEIN 1
MCDNFSAQAWRKQVCQNCFEPRDAHRVVETEEKKQDKPPPPPKVFNRASLNRRPEHPADARRLRGAAPIEHHAADVVGARAAEAAAADEFGQAYAPPGEATAAAAAPVHGFVHEEVPAANAPAANDDDDDVAAAAAVDPNGLGAAPVQHGHAGFVAAGHHHEENHAADDDDDDDIPNEVHAFIPAPPPLPVVHAPPLLPMDLFGHHGAGYAAGVNPVVNGDDEAESSDDEEGGAAMAMAAAAAPVDAANAEGAAARPGVVAPLMESIRGGVKLRQVPQEELEKRRKRTEKPSVMSEMTKRLQGKQKAAVDKAKAIVDLEQSTIEEIVVELNSLLQDHPVPLAHLKSLCHSANRLRDSVSKASKLTQTDTLLQQRYSWPSSIHQTLESVVRMVELVERAIGQVNEVATRTREAGVDTDQLPVINAGTAQSALNQLTTNVLLLGREGQQESFHAVHASQADVSLLLESASAPCLFILDCLFQKALQAARSLSDIGLSRYALTFRVNHAHDLLQLACKLNDDLMRCLALPRHAMYSEAQLSSTEIQDKYADITTVHKKTGDWDQKEKVALRSSTASVAPPVRTRLSAKEELQRNAVACVTQNQHDGLVELLSGCQSHQIEALHSSLIHAAVASGSETVVWVVEKLQELDNVQVSARHFEWLHEALTKCGVEVVECLVKSCGMDINVRSQDIGNTLLHVAARRQDFPAMAALTELGADILLVNTASHTPLMMVAMKSFPPVPVVRPNQDNIDDCFGGYVNKPNLSDVVLVCKDGDSDGSASQEKCYAHRILLCGRSPVFQAMLDTELWMEASQREISLSDIRYSVMLLVLQYIYTGTLFYPQDDLNLGVELLAAADRFLLKGMALQVEYLLCNKIEPDVVIPLYQAACLYDAPSLLRQCCHFILFNYVKLTDPDHETLFHILKNQRPGT